MCHAAESPANAIVGPLILLKLWAQDRFPHIAPHQLFRHHIDVGVDAAGRLDSHTFQVTRFSKEGTHKLDTQTPDQGIFAACDTWVDLHEINLERCHLSDQKEIQVIAQYALQALCDHHEFLKPRVEPGPEAVELVDAIHVYIGKTIQT
nr:hypothetical protein CFP56_77735 [Quercus suber]